LRLACATLLALLDPEVSLHVLGAGAGDVSEYLRFNTGVRSAALEEADFVLVTGSDSCGRISRVRRGSLAAPHESATIVYAPETLTASFEDPGVSLFLTGPGVKGEARLVVTGIAPEELDRLRTLADFPLGVDIWFASADCCLAVIPRSSRWRREG
jgi:phosphonate C-P lyase system protein PhnH